MRIGQGYALGKRSPACNTTANWQTYLCLAAYLMLWVASVVVIHAKAGLGLSEPLLIFAIGSWILDSSLVSDPTLGTASISSKEA
jgi:hypothetical protein